MGHSWSAGFTADPSSVFYLHGGMVAWWAAQMPLPREPSFLHGGRGPLSQPHRSCAHGSGARTSFLLPSQCVWREHWPWRRPASPWRADLGVFDGARVSQQTPAPFFYSFWWHGGRHKCRSHASHPFSTEDVGRTVNPISVCAS